MFGVVYHSFFLACCLASTAAAEDNLAGQVSSVEALQHDADCSGDGTSTCNVELLQKHAQAKDETSIVTKSRSDSSADSLTVMVFNTYLVEINILCGGLFVTPNLEHRSKQIAHWFNSLKRDEVPDVLVLNEIFGAYGTDVLQAICSKWWKGNSLWPGRSVNCDWGSNFEVATPVVGKRLFDFELLPSGGVVVLLKKGLKLKSYKGVAFTEQDFPDAKRGFMAVNLEKNEQSYWVVGTHTKCCVGNYQRRLNQLGEIRAFADKHIPADSRVVYAGDMNLYQYPWNTTCLGGTFVNEIPAATKVLGGGSSSTVSGTFLKDGFWLPLQSDVGFTWDNVSNSFAHYIAADRVEYEQRYDWVFAPGPDDTFATPSDMKYQYVPVKTSKCYRSELNKEGTDDLSDHYGVFAQICFSGNCPEVPKVSGHLGADGRMPGVSPDCKIQVPGGHTLPRNWLVRIVYIIASLLGFKSDPLTCAGCEEETALSLLGHATFGH